MSMCARFLVGGRVQGVWFRAWTREQALGLGLSGWVRNLPDGRVETLAMGDAATLERFEALLHQGPELSRVDSVVRSAEDCGEPAHDFIIRY